MAAHSEGFLKIANESKKHIQGTTPQDVKRKIDSGEKFFFVDVREDT